MRLRLLKLCSTVLVAAPLALLSAPVAQAAGSCGGGSGVGTWWVDADSGYPAAGTRLRTTTPTQWSVDRPSNSAFNQASWLWNANQANQAIEGGFFSGWFPYDNTWTNSLLPYYTLDNGGRGTRSSSALAGGSAINMDSVSGGHVSVGPTTFWFTYSVSNGQNGGQGEVKKTTNTWLGNGSGNSFTAFWTNNGSNWYAWGWHSDCNDSPYWISSGGANGWTNGGY
ncbi:MAG TPA: hypothetical protein VF763_08715 [Candidatus Limnocylindrales bacterium]